MSDQDPGLFAHLPEMGPEERRQARCLSWEEQVVARLLRFYDISHLAPELRRRCADRTGYRRLLFSWFHDEHPDFPVWFVFKEVHYLHRLTMEDFLKRFSKMPLFDAWLGAWEEAPEDWVKAGRPLAMVFKYLHGMGAAVLTDCERPLGEDNTRIVKNFRGQNLYLEPLDQFLTGLGWWPT